MYYFNTTPWSEVCYSSRITEICQQHVTLSNRIRSYAMLKTVQEKKNLLILTLQQRKQHLFYSLEVKGTKKKQDVETPLS